MLEKINPVVNFGTAPEAPASLGAKIYYWVKPFYVLVFLLALLSLFFALNKLSGLEEKRVPIKIEYPETSSSATVLNGLLDAQIDKATSTGTVIGSKTSKKYYFPWCGTVKRIRPENQIVFSSMDDARASGYLPGGNCKGLK